MMLLGRIFHSFHRNKNVREISSLQQVNRQYSSFIGSKPYNPEEKIDFEVSKNPDEWKYVTRLLPLRCVPDPVPKDNYSSGWRPQSSDSTKGPYYVKRSRNHMVPVYMNISQRGIRKVTHVRHVLGDIWMFTSDLKKYIEDQTGLPVGIRVDEVGCKVTLRGDYVHYAEKFILEKGM